MHLDWICKHSLLFFEAINEESRVLMGYLVPVPGLDREMGARPLELHQSEGVNLLTRRVRGCGSTD